MKRKRTTDWRKKLDQAGLQFLEGYRVANAIRHELADTPEAQQAIEEVARLLPGFRETKKVQITPELLKRLQLGKGGINTELVDLIRTIRKHQLKRLKTREVLEILTYVGIHVPDEEGLRVFEWRARKKGLL